MFFGDEKKKKREINKKILDLKKALFNFRIENTGFNIDTNSIIFVTGSHFSRSPVHFWISIIIYYIIGLHYSIFFLLIIYDWSWRFCWYHLAEELLSLEFTDYNEEFNLERIGGFRTLPWALIHAYNQSGYVFFGLHNYTELFSNTFEFNKLNNWIGYYNNYLNINKKYFKKKILLKNKKNRKINKINKEKIKNLSYIKYMNYHYKDIKNLYLYNKKIITYLFYTKQINKDNYNYFILYNKDRGLYWHKINEIYKKENFYKAQDLK